MSVHTVFGAIKKYRELSINDDNDDDNDNSDNHHRSV